MEEVVLVDALDNELGVCEKMEAHQKGFLHRAFSVFLFNDKGEWLLQKRADEKYHSAGLWSNTCCSHPRPNESIVNAAQRRLMEEIGMKVDLKKLFSFQYKYEFENGLVEHELDHVFVGYSNQTPELNLSEASDWKYIAKNDLLVDIEARSEFYTYWFKMIVNRLIKELS